MKLTPNEQVEALLAGGIANPTVEDLQEKIKEIKQNQEDMTMLLKMLRNVIARNPTARRQLIVELGGSLPGVKQHGYYTEKAANFLKPYVDAMIEDGYKPVCFAYEDFKLTFSKNSLKQFVHAGLRYLADNMDTPDLKYERFKLTVMVRIRSVGVYLINRAENERPQIARAVTESQDAINWKTALSDFLATSEPGEKFQMTDLLLSEDDQSYIESLMSNAEDFMHSVAINSIKVIHLRPEDK